MQWYHAYGRYPAFHQLSRHCRLVPFFISPCTAAFYRLGTNDLAFAMLRVYSVWGRLFRPLLLAAPISMINLILVTVGLRWEWVRIDY